MGERGAPRRAVLGLGMGGQLVGRMVVVNDRVWFLNFKFNIVEVPTNAFL